MSINKFSRYAPSIARFGVGIVFFIFGIDQLVNPENWVIWLPSFIYGFGIDVINLIYVNGVFDLVIGVLLLAGIYTRIISFIGILHLLGVILSMGYNEVAVRDLGILLVLISIFLQGSDSLCIESLKRTKKFFGWKRIFLNKTFK
jgi:uncharacterized membrane protein YphA (DoxX/SURF4 family)